MKLYDNPISWKLEKPRYRDLLWKGYINIVDPQSVVEIVNEYIRLVIIVLEEQ